MNNMSKICKILIVDDVEMNLVILSEIVKEMGHNPLTAISAKDAIDILENETPHLILLDVSMPDINGIEFCAMLKNDVYTKDIPVIFISALDSKEDLLKAFEIGAVDYISKPFDPLNVKMRVDTHLKLSSVQRELEIANRRLNSVIKQQMAQSRAMQIQFLSAISELIYERDDLRKFGRLSEASMARILSQALQLSPEFEDIITDSFIENMEAAASVHDIGSIKIPDRIIMKKEDFDDDERLLMNMHTIYGSEKILNIVKGNGMDELGKIMNEVILYHHENYDGSGFPEGLKGDKIPLSARIMRLIDAYDAMTNDRCYHKGISSEEAIEIVKRESGTWFDPDIVNIFVKIHRKFV